MCYVKSVNKIWFPNSNLGSKIDTLDLATKNGLYLDLNDRFISIVKSANRSIITITLIGFSIDCYEHDAT